jgi:hypothetical protein
VSLNSKTCDLLSEYRDHCKETKLIFNEQDKLKVHNHDEYDDYIIMRAPGRLLTNTENVSSFDQDFKFTVSRTKNGDTKELG